MLSLGFGLLLAIPLATIITIIDIKSSSPKPKDYILHSITADGTEFYVHMDEEEYGKWASENHIKIKKLQLEDK
tara:strand:+ start:149 stop:370 length:222 start_codon:yes stop_codon:yes gene_type:complete